MSRNSKVKRDARRKKEPDRPIRRLGGRLQSHAQLLDADGHAVGGTGWRDGEWLTVLGGKVVAHTDSAAMAVALLRRVVAVKAGTGQALAMQLSPALELAATREAAAAGMSLEAYLQALERERQERATADDVLPPGATDTLH